jgi:hypothetical protein
MSITQKIKANKGFISVVAMIIFAILIVTGLSVQRSNIDRLQNIRNTNNYYKAKYISESVMGKLNQLVESQGPGYSMDFDCNFKDGEIVTEQPKGKTEPPITPSPHCTDLLGLINPCHGKTSPSDELCEEAKYTGDIKISAEISGKTSKFVSSCSYGFSSVCYTIPEIGQGTAGNRSLMPVKNDPTRDCALYKTEDTPDLNHECNWNRLSFGSSSTDRVVIPMYYTKDNGDPQEYHKTIIGQPHFVLRVRTPCKEWNKTSQTCQERYRLYTGTENEDNDIVLQWQITGKCDDGGNEIDCGLIPWVKFDQFSGVFDPRSSGISEDRINIGITNSTFLALLSSSSFERDIIKTLNYAKSILNEEIINLSKPTFVLFLNKPLISEGPPKERIPYLEYQFLTPSQISNPESKLSVFASFDGNSSSNTIYKSIQGALIDFAIQN